MEKGTYCNAELSTAKEEIDGEPELTYPCKINHPQEVCNSFLIEQEESGEASVSSTVL